MPRCLSTYIELESEGYSPKALTRLSDRRKFPTHLDFERSEVMQIRTEMVKGMSISGVQEKISLRLKRGRLTPTVEDGEYILKPVPGQVLPRFANEVPANESLTMQLAEQVFDIDSAANALIRLADGELAYITRRFDRARDGEKIPQEDFCQLMGRSPQTAGRLYKYDASYEQLALALREYVAAYTVEVEKLFRRIVFCYAIGNGDAHLKNFSLQRDAEFGDYLLTPAYDLVCTSLHLPHESRVALDLFADDEIPVGVETHGFITGADLLELADRFGLLSNRAEDLLDEIPEHRDRIVELVSRSFLSDEAKAEYLRIFDDRLRAVEVR